MARRPKLTAETGFAMPEWQVFLKESVADGAREWAEHRTRVLTGYVEHVGESPIEQEMLAALFVTFDYTEPGCLNSYQGYRNKICPLSEADEFAAFSARQAFAQYADLHIMIVPQVAIGKYRADFLLIATAELTPVDGNQSIATLRVVIECDGHDHHDLTKEQARHDRQRDRWMQSKGLSVLRFAGSEIFKDASKCADEVRAFVDAWWEGLSV